MKKTIIFLLMAFTVFLFSGNIHFQEKPVTQKIDQKFTAADIAEKVPLYFIENKGQLDQKVRFHLRLTGMNVYFTPEEIVYQFVHGSGTDMREENIRMTYEGMNERVEVEAEGRHEVRVNFFTGNDPEKWVRGAGAYRQVIYRGIYPDIDLAVYGDGGKLKHEYRVKPGGKVDDIQIKYEGIKGLGINEKGELEVRLNTGKFKEDKPFCYQMTGNGAQEIESSYTVSEERNVSFQVGEYKKDKELIIDPELVYSTYLGGSDRDIVSALTVDDSGHVYAAGGTLSSDFPYSFGAYDTSYNGQGDVFVAKLNPNGSLMSYLTFIGGSDAEAGGGIAVDSSGNAYITGMTESSDFPVSSGAYDKSFNGSYMGIGDAFIFKLNSYGDQLLYSTYIGGSSGDMAAALALDTNKNVYITGTTLSNDFPVSSAYDTNLSGMIDGFVTKVNPANTGLSDLVYSTYLGGSGNENCNAIAVNEYGYAFVTGETDSSDYPTVWGDYDTSHNGDYDVFVTKLGQSGAAIYNSTFIGGAGDDRGCGIVLDSSGSYYVTGTTYSASAPFFPTTAGAYDSTNNYFDAFVAKFEPLGRSLLLSTYIGGGGGENGESIKVDEFGNVYISGRTRDEHDLNFPTTPGAYDVYYNGGDKDAFVSKLNAGLSALLYSTYLGGGGDDNAYCMDIDSSRNVYAGGYAAGGFPMTLGSFDYLYNGGDSDGFLTKLIPGVHEDFLGTWNGQGVYYKDAEDHSWNKLASPADVITCGDIFGDKIHDLIGLWTGQGGIWVKNSSNQQWTKLSSTAVHFGVGDMNGDSRTDFLGTWTGQGVYFRDSSSGSWVKMASPASMVAAGDLDGDGTDDLIGVWPSQNGAWTKYSSMSWDKLSSVPVDITVGDMNGDGRDDFVGTWTGQGVYFRDSCSGSWVKMASPASMVAAGDLDGDGTDDLIGVWPSQGGSWVKYSSTAGWAKLGSTPSDIGAGFLRGYKGNILSNTPEMEYPFYFKSGEGPDAGSKDSIDWSHLGPGGWNFIYQEENDLIPGKTKGAGKIRTPGPGEQGFAYTEQKNLFPQLSEKRIQEKE